MQLEREISFCVQPVSGQEAVLYIMGKLHD